MFVRKFVSFFVRGELGLGVFNQYVHSKDDWFPGNVWLFDVRNMVNGTLQAGGLHWWGRIVLYRQALNHGLS